MNWFLGPCELVVSRLPHDSIPTKELTLVKAGIGSFGLVADCAT